MKLEFSGQIFEKSLMSNLMIIRPVGVELFLRMDRQKVMTKLIVAFRSFEKSD
jgi:hypothetical protein